MLDIGGWELFVILALALIVVGPKDLPVLVRKIGTWVGKARSMARDFQSGMNEAAREIELDELKKSADVSSVVREESRKIDSEVRRATDVNRPSNGAGGGAAARPTTASQAPRTPNAMRAAGLERKAPETAASANAGSAPAPSGPQIERRARDARDAEDDAMLADFERGARGGRDG